MRFITDRKRAIGLGAAHAGTEHHWYMIVSSVALVGLIPVFVIIFGSTLGKPYEEVVATYSRPFPAVVSLLTIWLGWMHFRHGAQMMIEDYARGINRKILLIALICISYTAMAAGLYAIVRIAI